MSRALHCGGFREVCCADFPEAGYRVNKTRLRVLGYLAVMLIAVGLSRLPMLNAFVAFAEALAACIPMSIFWWVYGPVLIVGTASRSAARARWERIACAVGLTGGSVAAIMLAVAGKTLAASFCFVLALWGAEGLLLWAKKAR